MSTSSAPFASIVLWGIVLVPAVVGAVLVLAPRAARAANPVALATAALGVAGSAVVAVQRPQVAVPFMAGTDLGLGVDALSALVLPTVSVVTLLVLAFAVGDLRESHGRFHGLMLLFAAAASFTATATTLPGLLMAWEVMGATSYALIGFWWRDSVRVSAGLTAFLTTRAGDLGLYAAAGAALAGGAGMALADLPDATSPWRDAVALGILVAALGKAAQLPFSFWLSRAMEGPSPVSALLHSAAMVAMGGYLLLRVQPLLAATGWAAMATAWVGVLTAVALGLVAVAQHDLKQLLAASTAAQLGFVVLAAGLGSVAGGTAQLVAHAATKALLFLAAGAWLSALGTKELDGLAGVARRWPLVGWAATVGALTLAGIPPLSLWATKDAVLAVALEQSPWLYAAGLAASVLSAAYAGRIVVVVWRGNPRSGGAGAATHFDEEERGTRSVNAWQQGPLVVLSVGAALLGLLALPPLGPPIARALAEPSGGRAAPLELAVSAVLALAVVLAVLRWPVPRPRWAVSWLGLEHAAHLVVVRPTLRLGAALARFDDDVLDRGVERLPRAVRAAARHGARFDDDVLDRAVEEVPRATAALARRSAQVDVHRVDGAVEGLALWVRRLGDLARTPQTGQLHQYYLHAVAVLAAGLLLLLTVR
ncbi:MAG: proton-conducting transporter membrane subunit [Pedococcus sp.]